MGMGVISGAEVEVVVVERNLAWVRERQAKEKRAMAITLVERVIVFSIQNLFCN
jgi:hypothetical protein